MPNDKKTPSDEVQGEGNYEASRDYDARTEKFVEKNKAKIPGYAKAAEKALEGPEGDALRDAEAKGRAKAKA